MLYKPIITGKQQKLTVINYKHAYLNLPTASFKCVS